jgi:glutamate--cysteine ligase
MSDIGYKSKNQAGLNIDYNSLDGYVDSLSKAINTPYPDYQQIGTVVNGEYRQLNSNILQIENEFYSIVRPKQIAKSCEKPTLALKRRGVRYIEMRSLDLDLFNPLGVDEAKLRFIEALLLTCLLSDSPAMSESDHKNNNANQLTVAHEGRKPDLKLNRNGKKVTLQDWAGEILLAMQPVCTILDNHTDDKPYSKALELQRLVVENPDLTASARILASMREQSQPFTRFALKTSEKHAQYFKSRQLDPAITAQFTAMAEQSHAKQHDIESQVQRPFAEFLQRYFTQTCSQDHD